MVEAALRRASGASATSHTPALTRLQAPQSQSHESHSHASVSAPEPLSRKPVRAALTGLQTTPSLECILQPSERTSEIRGRETLKCIVPYKEVSRHSSLC